MLAKCLVTLSLILAASAKPQYLVPSWLSPYASGYGYGAPLSSPLVAPTSYVSAPAAAYTVPSYPTPLAALVQGAAVPYPYSYSSWASSQIVQDYSLRPAVAPAVAPALPATYALPAAYSLPAGYEWIYRR